MQSHQQAPPTPAWLLLLPLLTLILIGLFLLLATSHLALLGWIAGTLILCAPFIWILISAFRPALPDRSCPKCQQPSLVLLDPQEELGVRCLDCAFHDPELRVPYLKNIMNDPEIAEQAGYILDDFGEARLQEKPRE